MGLRAIVIGTGWAGEGYSKALRRAGVDAVAFRGRTTHLSLVGLATP